MTFCLWRKEETICIQTSTWKFSQMWEEAESWNTAHLLIHTTYMRSAAVVGAAKEALKLRHTSDVW